MLVSVHFKTCKFQIFYKTRFFKATIIPACITYELNATEFKKSIAHVSKLQAKILKNKKLNFKQFNISKKLSKLI